MCDVAESVFAQVNSINFARSGGSTRSFDIEVELRNQLVHTFSSIEKDEYGRLYEFVKSKRIKIGSKTRGERILGCVGWCSW